MEDGSGPKSLIWLALAAVGVILLNRFMAIQHDSKEPPVIPQKLPYVGHIVGLIQYGPHYFQRISAKHPLPIYTLNILKSTTYVVNHPDLVAAVQRNTKTLSFNPIIGKFSKRICGPDDEGQARVLENLNGKEGEWGLTIETHHGMYAALAPGRDLDNMNRVMMQKVSLYVDSVCIGESPKTLDLHAWTSDAILMCSTDAVYGPENPFRTHPGLGDAFWTLESQLTLFLLDAFPSITASKGVACRRQIVEAFESYFRRGDQWKGSALIQARATSNHKYGVSNVNAARFEIADLVGILVNTAPSTFWILVHVYSNPELLQKLRQELTTITTVHQIHPSKSQRHLDITKMKESCPLLVATYQEVLRVRSFGSTVRVAMEDTLLNEQYLLKKDSTIQIPSAVLHADPKIWGADAADFRPERFLKQDDKKSKVSPGAFHAFGGGNTLCPGRHFATTEILLVAAMFILRFDLEPVSGSWALPKQNSNNLSTSLLPPASDIKVKVSKRAGYEKDEWVCELTESKSKFQLAV